MPPRRRQTENPPVEDDEVERHPAHPVDEDPEDHIGDELIDPWLDDEQKDWPNAEEVIAGNTDRDEEGHR